MKPAVARCTRCHQEAEWLVDDRCQACGGTLAVSYGGRPFSLDRSAPGIMRYRCWLPLNVDATPLSLGEGNTPLVRSASIGRRIGIEHLYFKLESSNPTGSYKDRIAAVGVSLALQAGKSGCVGTSSGNAGASGAAYAARARLPFHLCVLPNAPAAKLAQMRFYGAKLVAVERFGDDPAVVASTFEAVRQTAADRRWELLITAFRFNPYAMEGVKTIAFEVVEQLGGRAPDWAFVPAGGGGLLVGVAKGFAELSDAGLVGSVRMGLVQPEGCSAIVNAAQTGEPLAGLLNTSRISGLQVPDPPDGELAAAAVRRSDGVAVAVPDDEIYAAQRMLAAEEGIFCEPAGAAALAGLFRAARSADVAGTVVCCVTGTGFKDLDAVSRALPPTAPPLVKTESVYAYLSGLE